MNIEEQIKILSAYHTPFADQLNKHSITTINPIKLTTFQINLGKKCNQACIHCHVGASPSRCEEMDKKTVDQCLEVISKVDSIKTVDITGGAPEMNSVFKYLVKESRKLGKTVIDRCNLTILEEKGFKYLYDFLKTNNVEIYASLPYFRESKTDHQRGKGVFEKSITALKKLNEIGYGKTLPLNLIYNPDGLFISADQQQLQREFKKYLLKNYSIIFNELFCINNIPISRYLERLVKANKFEKYMDILKDGFNICTIDGLMCRSQISVSFEGFVYDCDFNQMLDLKIKPFSHISNFDYKKFTDRHIRFANHCYGCTAGSGSS